MRKFFALAVAIFTIGVAGAAANPGGGNSDNAPGQVKKASAPVAVADVAYRTDDTYLYVDVTGAPANTEVYVEVSSTPTSPNPSKEGVTGGLHKTSDADGKVTFRLLLDFIYPDLPRSTSTKVFFLSTEAAR